MSSFSLRLASFFCLLAVCSGGCSSDGDKLAQMNAKAKAAAAKQKTQAAQPKSRLDSQPLPPTMGQPLTQSQIAQIPSPVPAQQPTQAPVATPAQRLQSNSIQVALLVPLSGKNAALGQAMLNAAQMAVFDIAPRSFELMPRDTGSTPESAKAAAQDAMNAGARLLIGPVFASDVAAVKPLVQTSTVNMLALTTDVSLAEPGAYVMGFAPAPQVERAVGYAANHLNLRRFAALIPAGPYGALVHKAYMDAVAKAGAQNLGAESAGAIDKIIAQKDKIEALFLPLAGSDLKSVTDKLEAAGFDPVKIRFLGTGLWDEAGVGLIPLLNGAIYAAPEPQARIAFTESYKAAYGQDPQRLATLAYDAMALAAVLAANGMPFDRSSLSNPNGFAGMDGIFRLNGSGQAERGLAVLEVGPAGNRVLDPAPASFTGL